MCNSHGERTTGKDRELPAFTHLMIFSALHRRSGGAAETVGRSCAWYSPMPVLSRDYLLDVGNYYYRLCQLICGHNGRTIMSTGAASDIAERIAAIRRFNRFLTQRIGLLREGLLDSRWSLTEARLIYELAHADGITATRLREKLDLDAGYLSRLLKRLERKGLIARSRSIDDGRRRHLSLTDKGKSEFVELDRCSREQLATLLQDIPAEEQHRLVASMQTIETILSPPGAQQTACVIRPHQPGDMGWVIWRHGELYAREYGWNADFEALVARIVTDFMEHMNPARERCWIAERNGVKVGSIFLVHDTDEVARLRLLLVEPAARGLGIGGRLVDECVLTARGLGYRRISLWTNDVLNAARRIYDSRGFYLLREEPHHSFGRDLVGQYWELDLHEAQIHSTRGS